MATQIEAQYLTSAHGWCATAATKKTCEPHMIWLCLPTRHITPERAQSLFLPCGRPCLPAVSKSPCCSPHGNNTFRSKTFSQTRLARPAFWSSVLCALVAPYGLYNRLLTTQTQANLLFVEATPTPVVRHLDPHIWRCTQTLQDILSCNTTSYSLLHCVHNPRNGLLADAAQACPPQAGTVPSPHPPEWHSFSTVLACF